MKLSLTGKIILIVSCMSLVMFVVFVGISIQRQNIFNLQINRDKAISVAFALDTNIKTTKDIADISRLTNIIQKNILLNTDIQEIKVNAIDGKSFRTVASNIPENINGFNDPIHMRSFESDSSIDGIISGSHGKRLFRSVSPIHGLGENLGTYEILIDLTRMDKQFTQETVYLIVVYFCILSIFIGTSYALFRYSIITPLKKITEGFVHIAQGDYEYRLTIHSHDEFEYVSTSFNTMVQDLSYAQKEKLHHQEELEHMVTLRTEELHTKVMELEKMNGIMTGRELKMIELKHEIDTLKQQLNININQNIS